jgi:sulfite reductase alpha subunit-like flavoprotein
VTDGGGSRSTPSLALVCRLDADASYSFQSPLVSVEELLARVDGARRSRVFTGLSVSATGAGAGILRGAALAGLSNLAVFLDEAAATRMERVVRSLQEHGSSAVFHVPSTQVDTETLGHHASPAPALRLAAWTQSMHDVSIVASGDTTREVLEGFRRARRAHGVAFHTFPLGTDTFLSTKRIAVDDGAPLEYVGHPRATRVGVTLATGSSALAGAVHALAAHGYRVGLVRIVVLRPWSSKHLLRAVPPTAHELSILLPEETTAPMLSPRTATRESLLESVSHKGTPLRPGMTEANVQALAGKPSAFRAHHIARLARLPGVEDSPRSAADDASVSTFARAARAVATPASAPSPRSLLLALVEAAVSARHDEDPSVKVSSLQVPTKVGYLASAAGLRLALSHLTESDDAWERLVETLDPLQPVQVITPLSLSAPPLDEALELLTGAREVGHATVVARTGQVLHDAGAFQATTLVCIPEESSDLVAVAAIVASTPRAVVVHPECLGIVPGLDLTASSKGATPLVVLKTDAEDPLAAFTSLEGVVAVAPAAARLARLSRTSIAWDLDTVTLKRLQGVVPPLPHLDWIEERKSDLDTEARSVSPPPSLSTLPSIQQAPLVSLSRELMTRLVKATAPPSSSAVETFGPMPPPPPLRVTRGAVPAPKHIGLPFLFPEAFEAVSAPRPHESERLWQVRVARKVRLTPEEYDRNVFHIEFDVPEGFRYDMGEALGVYGHNDVGEVEDFLQWYGLNGHDIVTMPSVEAMLAAGSAELPVGYGETTTVSRAFTQVLDVFGKVTKQFLEALGEYATDPDERTQLFFLTTPEGKSAFRGLVEDTATVADVFRRFPSAHPPLHDLLALIPPIKPRHYSIASAQSMHPRSVHLLVVAVEWRNAAGRRRQGHCTRYLDGLSLGATVTVSVKPSVMKLPADPRAPVIMAGLGTGMAPFRAFIQERAIQKARGLSVGPMVLYFGSRHRSQEWLYGEELEEYERQGVVTHLRLAFSRDGPEKVYIQHLMEQDGESLATMLHDQQGSFYLCGPTWPEGPVQDAVVAGLVAHVPSVHSQERAVSLIQSWKEHERYVLEVY